MKCFAKFLVVTLFVNMTFAFTSCGDDSDDEIISMGGDTKTGYCFTANGTTYYYGIPLGFNNLYQIGDFSEGDGYYFLQINAFDRQLSDYSEIRDVLDGTIKSKQIDLAFPVVKFNLTSAKSGDHLALDRVLTSDGYDVVSPLTYVDIEGNYYDYYWGDRLRGDITFVSYKNVILTIKLKNVIFVPVDTDYDAPSQITVNGNLSFTVN